MHPMLSTLRALPDASALGASVLALLGVASGARPAAAAECRIALGGAPVEGWTLAVRELERSGSVPADCAVVAIEASGERARLVFQTRDGRRAERRLDHPDELVPALRALGVGAARDGASLVAGPGRPERARSCHARSFASAAPCVGSQSRSYSAKSASTAACDATRTAGAPPTRGRCWMTVSPPAAYRDRLLPSRSTRLKWAGSTGCTDRAHAALAHQHAVELLVGLERFERHERGHRLDELDVDHRPARVVRRALRVVVVAVGVELVCVGVRLAAHPRDAGYSGRVGIGMMEEDQVAPFIARRWLRA